MVIQKELKFFPIENTNTNKLSSAQIESFNKNGFIFPITIFSHSETAKITTYFETLLDSFKIMPIGQLSVTQSMVWNVILFCQFTFACDLILK